MKIIINIDEKLDDTEITVSCGKLTTDIEKMIAAIRILDRQITFMELGYFSDHFAVTFSSASSAFSSLDA